MGRRTRGRGGEAGHCMVQRGEQGGAVVRMEVTGEHSGQEGNLRSFLCFTVVVGIRDEIAN